MDDRIETLERQVAELTTALAVAEAEAAAHRERYRDLCLRTGVFAMDVRSSLGAATGYAELAEEEDDAQERALFLRSIRAAMREVFALLDEYQSETRRLRSD